MKLNSFFNELKSIPNKVEKIATGQVTIKTSPTQSYSIPKVDMSKTEKILGSIGKEILSLPKEAVRQYGNVQTTLFKEVGSTARSLGGNVQGAVQGVSQSLSMPLMIAGAAAIGFMILTRK